MTAVGVSQGGRTETCRYERSGLVCERGEDFIVSYENLKVHLIYQLDFLPCGIPRNTPPTSNTTKTYDKMGYVRRSLRLPKPFLKVARGREYCVIMKGTGTRAASG